MNRFIQELKLTNFLSFGSESESIELLPLNVLIGHNAAGKSNFVEAFEILRATSTDISRPIREGGGIKEWIWKSQENDLIAEIEATITYPENRYLRPDGETNEKMPLRYKLGLQEENGKPRIYAETIENLKSVRWNPDTYYYYRYEEGDEMYDPPSINIPLEEFARDRRLTKDTKIDFTQSVISQRKDPNFYPEITYLADMFSNIRLFREWQVGRNSAYRGLEKTDERADFIKPDGSNLAVTYANLPARVKRDIEKRLNTVYPLADRIDFNFIDATVQSRVVEEDGREIPKIRLSDGTIRYLFLLLILCHPSPPPLICIEEPEIGLHPDVIYSIADLLIEASERTQIIVTTHSSRLISALSSKPEYVVVCERESSGTVLKRLEPGRLAGWLERYELGELWEKGVFGGNRP